MSYERLTYREIGERLGISPDAARMKAKRENKAGRWKLVPGNHPNDTVHVDVPEGTLAPRPPRPEPAPAAPTRASDGADPMLVTLVNRIETLTDQLIGEKDAHARTLGELMASEAREVGTKHELERALAELAAARRPRRRRWWL